MTDAGPAADSHRWSDLRLAVRSVVSLGVGFLAFGWFLAGTFYLMARCDESCGSSDPNSWEWIGQFVLMLGGVALTARALRQGVDVFGPDADQRADRGTYRRNELAALTAATVWLIWARHLG